MHGLPWKVNAFAEFSLGQDCETSSRQLFIASNEVSTKTWTTSIDLYSLICIHISSKHV